MIILLGILFIFSCDGPIPPVPNNNTGSIHISLGKPTDLDSSDDYIIIRSQYVLSYNHNKNVPNWVAWELNADWFGDVDRYSGNFITDTSLPAGWYRVKHSDYTNSGYDRGHMVRSEERTKTIEDNKSTFILTNILPQTPDLNRGVWLQFEYYCEDLCKKENKELFVYAGGIFHTDSTIGNGVSVPDSCFKIVVILDRGQGLNNVNENTPVYAVVMPNIAGIRTDDWEKYKTTVRRIESSTGYNFLSAIKKNIQDVIENK
ncbi:MAG: DNA/RNA non-specific endonuclease [Actinobacteria bacterium]|nr:DNA/RNA non-specific endonuclease [Actinomycetota bacterium]